MIRNLSRLVIGLLFLFALHRPLGSLPRGLQEVCKPQAGGSAEPEISCKGSSVPSATLAPQPA